MPDDQLEITFCSHQNHYPDGTSDPLFTSTEFIGMTFAEAHAEAVRLGYRLLKRVDRGRLYQKQGNGILPTLTLTRV